MNENENNINNEKAPSPDEINLQNAKAEGSDQIDSQSDASEPQYDSVKAFNWSFSGDENGEPQPNTEDEDYETQSEDETEDDEANPETEAEGDEANPETETEGDEARSEDETEGDDHFECDPATEFGKKYRSKKEPSILLATALSGTAIILLILFAFAAALGVFSSGRGSVVYIPVASPQEPAEYDTSSAMLEDFLHSVVVIKSETEKGDSIGTGIILSSDGYIVTNHHVIKDADAVYVWLYGSETPEKASIVGHREIDDIAVIKIEKTSLRPATFASSASCRVGERVYAIGTPEGDEFGWSVTQGIISCPDREIKLYNSDGTLKKKMHVVQTDASVNHGNSGGPLINSRGEVVGIITLKLTDSAGMGFAIPSDGALIDIKAIIENGHADDVDSGISISRPLIGITGIGVEGEKWYAELDDKITTVSEDFAKKNPSSTFYAAIDGVYVRELSRGMDAENKLEVGDIITKANNIEVFSIYDLMDVINEFNGGEQLPITYYRDGKYYSVNITLGAEKVQ